MKKFKLNILQVFILLFTAASIVAADKVNSGSNQLKSLINNDFGKNVVYSNLNIEYPNGFNYLENIGIKHNQYVSNHYNGILSKSSNNEDDILNSTEFINANNDIQNSIGQYVDSDFDMSLLISDLLNKGYLTDDMSQVLNIFFDIYNNSENTQNIEDIVNFYINAISSTTVLSNEDKEALMHHSL